jgi:hypothetical protein
MLLVSIDLEFPNTSLFEKFIREFALLRIWEKNARKFSDKNYFSAIWPQGEPLKWPLFFQKVS